MSVLTEYRYKAAGVGVTSDATVAKRLGVPQNTVSQWRARHGIQRPMCMRRTVVIKERVTFHVGLHAGTGTKTIRAYEWPREMYLVRFLAECRLGHPLRKDERMRDGKVVRGNPCGFLIWRQTNNPTS